MDDTEERLAEELKTKRICRFCLAQDEPLSDIFTVKAADGGGGKNSKMTTPLTLQIMACVAIEVYKDDGMPSTICDNCRHLMDHSYRFKQICKKADTLLKTYPLTGVWPEKLQVPVNLFKSVSSDAPTTSKVVTKTQPPVKVPTIPSGVTLRKTNPASQPVVNQEKQVRKVPSPVKPAPAPVTVAEIPPVQEYEEEQQLEPEEEEAEEEEDVKPRVVKLSIEDLKNIKQGKPINKTNLIKKTYETTKSGVKILHSEVVVPPKPTPLKTPSKPKQSSSPVKVINGNLSIVTKKPVILNSLKPARRTEEHFVQTGEGTLEIVCMESLDLPLDELDPIKNAPPVETNVFPCSECERSFPLRQLLEIHMQNHVRERNFPCEMCDKRFFSKYDLAKHNLTHTGERPYVCVICKAAFSRSTLLTRHQKIHKDQPKYLCMYCERTFLSNEELQKHAETHQKKRPFQCQKCPKSFAYKQGLERHEVTHEQNLPFPCEHCDLSFATSGKLARHLTAHAGSRPYPCRLCSRSFVLSHHLTRHIRSHQGGKGAYKCSDCANVFYSQDELIYHSAIHATKSLTCPLCREHFESIELVTEHIKEHSEGIQYACDYCDLLFASESKLDNHCQKEHLSVLAMDRATDATLNSTDDSESSQQFIIEEIAINRDGSQMITTFVDGEEKEKVFIKKQRQQPVIKSEITCEKAQLSDQNEYGEEEYEEEQPGDAEENFYEDEEQIEEEDEQQNQPEPVPVKLEKAVPKPPPAVPKPTTSKPTLPKPSLPAEPPKSTQQKLETFFKKSPIAASTPQPKSVGEVLKNLPKGVIVKRPAGTTPVPKAPEVKQYQRKETVAPKPVPPKPVPVQQQKPSPKSAPTTPVPKPSPKSQPANELVKAIPAKPPTTPRLSPRTATKRPLEDQNRSSPPVKKVAVEPVKKAPSTPTATPSTSTASPAVAAKPVPKGVPPPKTPTTSTTPTPTPDKGIKKGKTFEMKIGDRVVKVQKVVMTKSEVAAMARDGKIEMQGDTMILKQPRGKKQ